MKKIFYFIFIPLLVSALYSCNPLDDAYNQLDKDSTTVNGVVKVEQHLTLTLTEADYGLLKGEKASGAANAAKYFDFSSNEEAKSLVSIILNKKYRAPTKNSSALVTYKVYNKIEYKNVTPYTLVAQDYTDAGSSYPNFNSEALVEAAATAVAPKVFPNVDLKDGYTIALTYDYFSGGVKTLTNNVIYWGGVWHLPYSFIKADYTAMTQAYPDFTDKALAQLYISNYMNVRFPQNTAGEFKAVTYAYYANKVTTDVMLLYKNDGTKWNLQTDIQDFTSQFGFDGKTWAPDNTITYVMVPADYSAMAAASTASDATKSSLSKYNDFDYSLWTDVDVINGLIANRLLTVFPNAKEGQKYLVKYAAYKGPSSVISVHFELQGGKYKVID
nr:hypothetical protein [uncultured Pedobacter sp.]